MKIYPALNSIEKVHFHDTVTEADIQAQLFGELKKDGFSVKAGVNYLRAKKVAGCQFDLVIHKGKTAVAIIEVKSPFEGPRTDLNSTHQGLKYRSFGIPVILFWDMDNYPELKNFLKNAVEKELMVTSSTVFLRNPEGYRRLHKALDIASMNAFDLGMHDLESYLEKERDSIKVQMA